MAVTRPIQRLGEKFADLALKYIPDPYVLVVILTALAFLGALGVGSGPQDVMNAWYDGVWTFLEFMAQFAIILMTGDAIAKSPAVTKLLKRISSIPSSQSQAVAFVAVVSMIAGLISWGLGLIVGAVMARQVAYQGKESGLKLHYPLLAAAGYTSLMIWHSGLTTSSGLIMATPSSLPEAFQQYTAQGIPLSQTVGSTVNIVTVVLLLLVIPPVMAALHPDEDGKIRELPQRIVSEMSPGSDSSDSAASEPGVTDGGTESSRDVESDGGTETVDDRAGSAGTVEGEPDPVDPSATKQATPADRLNKSVIFTILIAVFPAYYFVNAWVLEGTGIASLSLNSINAFFLFFAIVLWRTPEGIVAQMEESVENVAGIIFQFPFYAGISGILTATALGTAIANAFASVATPLTWPVLGLISAGIVNVFVPSGGGQWVAQGPILLETTQQLGMPLYTAVVIEMMGDQLTNMIQPFWALPLLALADLRARDIIGYAAVAMVAAFVVMAITMTLFLGVGI
jgi:short-chain fatty acids transporter